MPARNIITITTDFGVRDHFVGAMKGVILTINPEANLLDISHDVASYSVVDGAFTIAQAYPYFPAGHGAPGGGRSRRRRRAPSPAGASRQALLRGARQWRLFVHL